MLEITSSFRPVGYNSSIQPRYRTGEANDGRYDFTMFSSTRPTKRLYMLNKSSFIAI